jgi:hypothetical protein
MIPDALGSLVRVLFFPTIVVSLLLAYLWRRITPGPLQTRLQITAVLLFFAPQLVVLLYMNRSIDLVLHQEGVLVVWFAAVAAAPFALPAIHRARAAPLRPGRSGRPIARAVVIVVCGTAALYFGREFLEDLILPAVVVDGHVTALGSHRGTRSPRSYWVAIDDHRYAATLDVYRSLHRGDAVRAEVAAGSGIVLKLEPR